MCLSVLLLLAAASPVVTFSPRGSVHVHSPGAAQLEARQGTAVPAGSPHFHLCAVCCSMTRVHSGLCYSSRPSLKGHLFPAS